ncbi:GNAT family N-acetyltransferase [Aurantiacibacter sp. MUD61]|uniref:GNAT family N-acetyltransferase n=1 Tax=Aurantiacibacter sp. MUD61 TaxID=3009083 RepID=UPI0022F13F50|nr:GNAT family N-acetyltransferase [Aurantiacibacter sp. MUD61]
MSALIIRDATLDDLQFIAALCDADEVAAARDPLRNDHAEQMRDGFMAITSDPNHRLLIAERNGGRVGSFQLSFIPGVSRRGAWRGQIESVRVAAESRSQGIGEEMMRWAIAQCEARGCCIIQLTSDRQREAAHRFYKRLGFEASHSGFKLKLG